MAQIAGRVAILPKGKWENNVTYSKLDLVYYENASYVARKASTNVIPADDTETWMLVLKGIDEQLIDDIISGTTPVGNSASLGGETAEAWQNKLDNIQTTSNGTLSQAGWYRVAEYVGASAETCTLQIFRPWYYNQGEMHTLHYEYVNPLSPVIKSLSDMSSDHLITKSRITTDGTKKYFEIYYISSNANDVDITLLQGKPYDKSWQAITPTLTEETIEGVTITTTYDIPANASPVTDRDIGYLSKFTSWDNSWTSVKTPSFGIYLITPTQIANGLIADLPEDATSTTHYWLMKLSNTDENLYLLFNLHLQKMWIGNQYGSSVAWLTNSTTADLAMYIPKVGGTIKNSSTTPFAIESTVYDIILQEFKGISGTLGALGFSGVDNPVYQPSGGGVKSLLHTANFSDYALPLDGSKSFGSNIFNISTQKHASIRCDGNHVAIYTHPNGDETNSRSLVLTNPVYDSDINDPVYIRQYIDGVYSSYVILHNENYKRHAYSLDGTSVLNAGSDFKTQLKPTANAIGLRVLNNDGSMGGGIGIYGVSNAVCTYLGVGTAPWSTGLKVYSDSRVTIGESDKYTMLHTGNSNAVISASSAPSDTAALWYDTVNKMLKRYVDGAWQQ